MVTKQFISFCMLISIVYAKNQVYLGGIFHDDNYEAKLSFQSSVTRANMDNNKIEFIPLIYTVDRYDSFQAEKIACEIASKGVAAIFGPSSIQTSSIVGSVCQELGIPHITTHWTPEDIIPNHHNHKFTRNFFPDSTIFARALHDIIIDYEWKGFTIIYEKKEGFEKLQDILQIHGPTDKPVIVRQLSADEDYQPLLKEIVASGHNQFILDCSPDKVMDILRQAVGVKMMEDYQNYFITSLDAHTLDFSEFQSYHANITTVRMMNPKSYEVETAVYDWRHGQKYQNNNDYFISVDRVTTEAALFHDAVLLFTKTFIEFVIKNPDDWEPPSLQCSNSNRWNKGRIILTRMDEKTELGMTGRIIFNDIGKRTDFFLEVLELSQDSFKQIASWDPKNNIGNYTRTQSEVYSQITQSLQNRTLIVAVRLGKPYLNLKKPEEGQILTGNDRFEGYAVDIIEEISLIRGFKYKFELAPDNKYGSYDKEKKRWDGLVKMLLDRKADIAICDLTITYERRTAVDFTMPFMTLGISILFAKPSKQPPGLFSFMSPLSIDVWMYMATAYLCISVLLFFLAKMAADDWENPHPCDDNPEELETIWNMQNCSWLTAGSIMQQGCDLLPKAVSTRIAAGLWWFFALIVISSYTANLAAFLTLERSEASIANAEDLAKSKIKYGAVIGGSTLSFFRESNDSIYKRMYASMESAGNAVFTKNNDEGEERVAKGNRQYAFLMESTSIEYIVQKNCNLTQVGGLLDSKGYGIAMQVNWPYRTHISQAVLKLQEEGKLQRLKDRWWKEKNTQSDCGDDKGSGGDDTPELGMDNVGGVFLVLLSGCCGAFFLGIMEFLFNARKVAIEEKITPWEALKTEFFFALDVRISTKPVRTNVTDSNSLSTRSGRSNSIKTTDNTIANTNNGSFKHIDNV